MVVVVQKVDSVPPAHHFHVGMQVDIDYADEGMWPIAVERR